jgi:rhamnopyranosyl-N-acetylglucosaminyl-diphospho-decaprenol beta-1,3/1,4-galactofuranosyltransferase
MTGDSARSNVVAVVVTYRRPRLLTQTLDAIGAQTTTVAQTIVVDNSPDPELQHRISDCYPSVEYIASPANLGSAGGFHLGFLATSHPDAVDWYWCLDDDSPPAPTALELALAAASEIDGPIGAVGRRGGHVRYGRIRHDLRAGSVDTVTRADFLLVDGSIISGEAIRRAGYPRDDFFIMMEDLEFTTRIHESGLPLFVRPDDGSANLYQGSGAPWRGYYQSRNYLRMAIERRSILWFGGWLTREIGINSHHLWHRRWSSMRFRCRGAVDAVRNRMGRVVDPS